MVEEHCQQQLQEGMIETAAEFSEGLSEFSDICTDFCPSLFTEESSGNEAVEEPQKPNLKPLPTKLDPNATTQATNIPLPASHSPDQVHILPKPTAHSTQETPTAEASPSALLLQYFRKLVAFVQTFSTTSKTLAELILHGTADGSYRNHLGSDLEHLNLNNSTSSISSSSLQKA